ncbi:MAG: isoprenylcysteine carboxylmethyltransferase family protein [Nitrosomonadales bacterium]|nr:isoprenylcysteine carboxylmethyltransferase family protein [Nitrosomonadales bacterium]
MLGLFVLNMQVWNATPNSTYQIISGLLFFVSLLLVLSGVGLLQLSGQPGPERNDATLFGFEKTTTLVTTGVYRHVRHPIYGSLLFLCWGFFFKQPSLTGGVLATIACGFIVAATRAEEIENIGYFGEQYREYMQRTKMFVPFIL